MSLFDRLATFAADQTGISWLVGESRRGEVIRRASWWRTLGPLLGVLFLVEAVTGAVLMLSYVPDARDAWGSVYYANFVLPGGWLVRGLHHAASEAMLIATFAHLVAELLRSRDPESANASNGMRPATWNLGVVAFALVLVLAITGRALPWDQFGYWARQVELNIAAGAPGGNALVPLIQGGSELGTLTLTRFHMLHVFLLPLVFLIVARAHRLIGRRAGVDSAPATATAELDLEGETVSQRARNVALALVAVAGLFIWTFAHHGTSLDAPADPTSDYPARPEWFLMPLFALRKLLHGPQEVLGLTIVTLLIIVIVLAIPHVEKMQLGKIPGRALAMALLAMLVVGGVALGESSARKDAKDASFQASVKKADARAAAALSIAKNGIPPEGALAMMARDPELRGEAIFSESCAGCHVLGTFGEIAKTKAPVLDGWGNEAWLVQMIHDPDGDHRFGRTTYKGEMPSLDVAPKEADPDAPPFKAMSGDDIKAAAAFLAAQGDEPGDAALESAARRDPKVVARGEAIVTKQCTSCHLWKGKGDDGDQGLAPELSGYGSVAWVKSQIANPSSASTYRTAALDETRKGHMPRFDDQLSPADLDAIATYTRSHARSTVPR